MRAVWCFACTTPSRRILCRRCAASLHPVPERLIPPGVVARAAFEHAGAARVLVHRIKYRPVTGAVELLADAMAQLVTDGDVLVPMPRAVIRRFTTGVDPAHELAAIVGRLTGMPVERCLAPPWWWRRHAGATRGRREVVPFGERMRATGRVVLVDDVLTTGRTATSAARALQVLPALVVTATGAGRVNVG